MTFIEFVAVVFSLLSVYLTIKKNIHLWWTGIVGILLYAYVFLEAKMYFNFGLQFIFIVQSLYGWIYWNKTKSNSDTKQFRDIILSLLFVLGVTFSSSLFSLFITVASNFSISFSDLFTTLLSIIALYLLTKRYIENWFFWIIANIVYVFMFLEAQLYFSAVLYFINLILCYKGIKEWEKNLIQ